MAVVSDGLSEWQAKREELLKANRDIGDKLESARGVRDAGGSKLTFGRCVELAVGIADGNPQVDAAIVPDGDHYRLHLSFLGSDMPADGFWKETER